MTQRVLRRMFLVLGALVSATASAQDDLPSVRNAAGPIPANSALMLDTPGGAPGVVVVDQDGALIEGASTDIANSGSRFYAWLPRRPLEPGEYEVRFLDAQSAILTTAEVTITDAVEVDPLPLTSEPVVSRVTHSDVEECCTTPIGQRLTGACFTVQQSAWIKLQPGLSASNDVSVSDYVYRLRAPGGSADLPFTNLYDLTHASFNDRSERYCAQLEALELATGRLFLYEALSICAELDDGPLGTYDVEVSDGALRASDCPVPPDAYRERWCALNEDACDDDAQAECELHAFVCDDGPLPSGWIEDGQDTDEPSSQAAMSTASSSGCSVGARGAAGSGGALGLLFGLLCSVLGVRLYHNPKCSKSRHALALLEARGLELQVIEYLKNPPSAAELDALLKLLDLEPRALMRTGEPAYREQGLDDPSLTRAELIARMVANPIVIERPIAVCGERAVVGRPPERVLEIV